MEDTRTLFREQFLHPGEDLLATRAKTKSNFTTREELLAVLRQDLRNPIGTATSCANMLLEDPEFKNLPSELQHWLVTMKRSTEASLRIVNDILDVERIDEGSLKLNLTPHTLNRIVAQAVEAFAHSISQKKISLQAESQSASAEVPCDLDRVIQVLSNLLSNAEKYTPEGGIIRVNALLQKNEALFSVQDTGLGIPPARIVNIFKRFWELRNRDRSGPGLGLYISQRLIEAHGGKMWAESRPGKGSTFFFTIPLRGKLSLH